MCVAWRGVVHKLWHCFLFCLLCCVALVAAWRTLSESIYLRTHGHWSTFAHDGQMPGELTSFADATNLPFQNLALDDVTYYPWTPIKPPRQPPSPQPARPSALSSNTKSWALPPDDELAKFIYTRYVNFEPITAPASTP